MIWGLLVYIYNGVRYTAYNIVNNYRYCISFNCLAALFLHAEKVIIMRT